MRAQRRELFECSECGAALAVIYEAEPEEPADVSAAVACLQCGWASFVNVTRDAARPLEPRYRVEKLSDARPASE